jgi:hypothetical protein
MTILRTHPQIFLVDFFSPGGFIFGGANGFEGDWGSVFRGTGIGDSDEGWSGGPRKAVGETRVAK